MTVLAVGSRITSASGRRLDQPVATIRSSHDSSDPQLKSPRNSSLKLDSGVDRGRS